MSEHDGQPTRTSHVVPGLTAPAEILVLLRRRSGGTDATFTARELEIVRGIGRGESNHDIGEHLHLRPHSVKYHVASTLRRHGCSRRAELVRLAADRHLLDPG